MPKQAQTKIRTYPEWVAAFDTEKNTHFLAIMRYEAAKKAVENATNSRLKKKQQEIQQAKKEELAKKTTAFQEILAKGLRFTDTEAREKVIKKIVAYHNDDLLDSNQKKAFRMLLRSTIRELGISGIEATFSKSANMLSIADKTAGSKDLSSQPAAPTTSLPGSLTKKAFTKITAANKPGFFQRIRNWWNPNNPEKVLQDNLNELGKQDNIHYYDLVETLLKTKKKEGTYFDDFSTAFTSAKKGEKGLMAQFAQTYKKTAPKYTIGKDPVIALMKPALSGSKTTVDIEKLKQSATPETKYFLNLLSLLSKLNKTGILTLTDYNQIHKEIEGFENPVEYWGMTTDKGVQEHLKKLAFTYHVNDKSRQISADKNFEKAIMDRDFKSIETLINSKMNVFKEKNRQLHSLFKAFPEEKKLQQAMRAKFTTEPVISLEALKDTLRLTKDDTLQNALRKKVVNQSLGLVDLLAALPMPEDWANDTALKGLNYFNLFIALLEETQKRVVQKNKGIDDGALGILLEDKFGIQKEKLPQELQKNLPLLIALAQKFVDANPNFSSEIAQVDNLALLDLFVNRYLNTSGLYSSEEDRELLGLLQGLDSETDQQTLVLSEEEKATHRREYEQVRTKINTLLPRYKQATGDKKKTLKAQLDDLAVWVGFYRDIGVAAVPKPSRHAEEAVLWLEVDLLAELNQTEQRLGFLVKKANILLDKLEASGNPEEKATLVGLAASAISLLKKTREKLIELNSKLDSLNGISPEDQEYKTVQKLAEAKLNAKLNSVIHALEEAERLHTPQKQSVSNGGKEINYRVSVNLSAIFTHPAPIAMNETLVSNCKN